MIRTSELLFFAFGITTDEIDVKGLAVAVDKAYLDLSRTIEYRLSSDDLKNKSKNARDNEDFKELKKSFVGEIKVAITDAISNYSSFDTSIVEVPDSLPPDLRPFDLWHYSLTKRLEEIVDIYNKDRLFKLERTLTCGQIQKWINMALKYLRIMGICPFDDLDLHVPLDEYILRAMRRKGPIGDSFEVNGLEVKVPYDIKWSRIRDYSEYFCYQFEIRTRLQDSLAPIEWESRAWMAESVRRSK